MDIEQASQLGWQLLSEQHGLARNGWHFRWSGRVIILDKIFEV